MIWLAAPPPTTPPPARGSNGKMRWTGMFAWAAALLICIGVIYAIFRPPADQLITPHRTAAQARAWWATPAAVTVMRRDSDLLLLVGGAVVLLLSGRVRIRNLAVPLIWFACAAVAVQMHRPVRYHHSPLLVVPAAWAAGISVDALLGLRQRAGHWRGRAGRIALTVLLIALLLWESGKSIVSARRMFVGPMRRDERRLVSALTSHRDQTRWVVTDQQIYPFAAGLLSPPELAVTSGKRRDTGAMGDELVLEVVQRYQPEQVLLSRFDFGPAITQYLDTNYRLIGSYKIGAPQPARLYFRGREPAKARKNKKTTTPPPTTTTTPAKSPTTQATQPADSPIQVN
jgi:hypothetical protein